MRTFPLILLTSVILGGAATQADAQWAANGTAIVLYTNHPAGPGSSFNATWGQDVVFGSYLIINGVLFSSETGCNVTFILSAGIVHVSCPPYWVDFKLIPN
jgi:hypothetical protein